MTVIKRWDNDEIIIEGRLSVKELCERAAKNNISLYRADLVCAGLRRADLSDADLRDVNLRRADLSYADLRDVNLSDADLSGADLRGVRMEFVKLKNAKVDYKLQDGLIEKIASIVIKKPERLFMKDWHCGTSHCVAGWACELNEVAKDIEKSHGTEIAGLLTLGPEAHSHFFDKDDEALDWLKKVDAGII